MTYMYINNISITALPVQTEGVNRYFPEAGKNERRAILAQAAPAEKNDNPKPGDISVELILKGLNVDAVGSDEFQRTVFAAAGCVSGLVVKEADIENLKQTAEGFTKALNITNALINGMTKSQVPLIALGDTSIKVKSGNEDIELEGQDNPWYRASIYRANATALTGLGKTDKAMETLITAAKELASFYNCTLGSTSTLNDLVASLNNLTAEVNDVTWKNNPENNSFTDEHKQSLPVISNLLAGAAIVCKIKEIENQCLFVKDQNKAGYEKGLEQLKALKDNGPIEAAINYFDNPANSNPWLKANLLKDMGLTNTLLAMKTKDPSFAVTALDEYLVNAFSFVFKFYSGKDMTAEQMKDPIGTAASSLKSLKDLADKAAKPGDPSANANELKALNSAAQLYVYMLNEMGKAKAFIALSNMDNAIKVKDGVDVEAARELFSKCQALGLSALAIKKFLASIPKELCGREAAQSAYNNILKGAAKTREDKEIADLEKYTAKTFTFEEAKKTGIQQDDQTYKKASTNFESLTQEKK